MKTAQRDWRVVTLAVASGGSGLLAISIALSAIAYAGFGMWFRPPGPESPEPISVIVIAGALALISAVMFAASYTAFRALRGQQAGIFLLKPLRGWQVALLLVTWLSAGMLAQVLVTHDPWRWTAPIWHLLAIGAPLYLLVRLATAGILGGSRLRLWGALSTGLILGTGLAAAAEIGVLLLGLAAGGVYLAFNPEQLHALQNLVGQLGQISSVEEMFSAFEPLITNPLTFLGLLMAVSVITPFIEEFAKSTATWALFDRLNAPSQGFWVGALSGAGFALFEGLIASADPTAGWGFILLIRGGSSIMHVVASALAGWGIADFRATARMSRLVGGYGMAIFIHATWNAAVVAIGYGGVRLTLSQTGMDVIGLATATIGAITLTSLLVLLPVSLVVFNHSLRSPRSPELLPANASAGSEAPEPGKHEN